MLTDHRAAGRLNLRRVVILRRQARGGARNAHIVGSAAVVGVPTGRCLAALVIQALIEVPV